jgi:hypothetical protein
VHFILQLAYFLGVEAHYTIHVISQNSFLYRTNKVSKARTPYIFTNAFQVTTRQEAEQEDQTNWNNWIPI